MAFSIATMAIVIVFDAFVFVLAIGAEMRRSTGKVVPDEYDERTYCAYDSDASTAYGLSAFGLLLLSQALLSAVTRCLCCARGTSAGGSSRACAVAFFVISWITFAVAEICLLAGSARNAYHTKYIGNFAKKDLQSCRALRKGVFAAGAAFSLLTMLTSLIFYWSYSKVDTGGWVKHQNEGGMAMTDYGSEKVEYGRTRV